MKRNGHIHTPFCPHGTKDSFEQYIEQAIQAGFEDITFTEHAPLPTNFVDPTPLQDSGMQPKDVDTYIKTLQNLQVQYANNIKIRIGFEVDYIMGYEEETKQWLHTYGPVIDDAILSVHFLKINGEYICIDYSDSVFMDTVQKVGSVERLYHMYYDTVQQSIEADLGTFKPKRIGHPTLIHKFQHAHQETIDDHEQIEHVLQSIKHHNYELDVNSAGYAKKFCLESYPPIRYIEHAKQLQIPLVFGSDAHQAKDFDQFFEELQPYL